MQDLELCGITEIHEVRPEMNLPAFTCMFCKEPILDGQKTDTIEGFDDSEIFVHKSCLEKAERGGPHLCPVCNEFIVDGQATKEITVDFSGPENGPSENDISEVTVHLACSVVPLHKWQHLEYD